MRTAGRLPSVSGTGGGRTRRGFLRRCRPGKRSQVRGRRLFGVERRDIRRKREHPHFRLGMNESIPPSGDDMSRRTPNLERLDTGT